MKRHINVYQFPNDGSICNVFAVPGQQVVHFISNGKSKVREVCACATLETESAVICLDKCSNIIVQFKYWNALYNCKPSRYDIRITISDLA